MNKILVGEIHGVRRQLKLAVKLAYIYSAFVMVDVERLLCSTSAGRIGKPNQLLCVVHPLLYTPGYFMQCSW